ncbi:hypothetical protein [Coraliomargarita parva]|uniref:hypothetical protein n=1 Tax=Coraliomargarita parva TaxID=3014050 RepID=UPI0022B4C863|nr:hypothetical protein [Coraliomargarita parva]
MSLILSLIPLPAVAYDGDASGVSDVFESIYEQVLPADEDPDQDGYNNLIESLLGTDPLNAASPGDFGLSMSGASLRIRIPAESGLRYRVQTTDGFSSWNIPTEFVTAEDGIDYVEFDTSGISRMFFRIEVEPPLNSDTDGLNDWEEGRLGTDPLHSDTDDDMLDDDIETMLAGSNPHLVDSDGDGFVDKEEYEFGSNPRSSASVPAEFLEGAAHVIQVHNLASPAQLEGLAWSQAVSVNNPAPPTALEGDVWSAPVLVRNNASSVMLLSEVWSAPVTILKQAP